MRKERHRRGGYVVLCSGAALWRLILCSQRHCVGADGVNYVHDPSEQDDVIFKYLCNIHSAGKFVIGHLLTSKGTILDEPVNNVSDKRYIAAHDGRYDDVYVIRDGQKLKFEEVATFEPEGGDPDV